MASKEDPRTFRVRASKRPVTQHAKGVVDVARQRLDELDPGVANALTACFDLPGARDEWKRRMKARAIATTALDRFKGAIDRAERQLERARVHAATDCEVEELAASVRAARRATRRGGAFAYAGIAPMREPTRTWFLAELEAHPRFVDVAASKDAQAWASILIGFWPSSLRGAPPPARVFAAERSHLADVARARKAKRKAR